MNRHWTETSPDNFLSRITFDFIAQLEQKMESLPLTQSELAKKLDVTEGYVSQILNNPSNLSLRTIIKYARALGLKVAVVAYDDNDPDNTRGLVNSEIFSICWEKQGKPVDFFSLSEQKKVEQELFPSTQQATRFVLPKDNSISSTKSKAKYRPEQPELTGLGIIDLPTNNSPQTTIATKPKINNNLVSPYFTRVETSKAA